MRNFLGVRAKHKKYGALALSVLLGLSVCSSVFAAEQTGTTFNKGRIDGKPALFASSSDFKKYNVWDSTTKTYTFTKDSVLNVRSITGEAKPINVSAPGVTLTLNSKDEYGIQSYCGRSYKVDHNHKKVYDVNITAKRSSSTSTRLHQAAAARRRSVSYVARIIRSTIYLTAR